MNTDITPVDRDPQEPMRPIGILPVLAADDEPTQSIQMSIERSELPERSDPPELDYETPTTDIASPTLEATVPLDQPVMGSVDVKDPPPVLVSTQGNTTLMEAAASRPSSSDQADSPPPNSSDGDIATQENSPLFFSSPYLLSRFFTMDYYNESLRHEAGIAEAEGRIRGRQNMFIQRVVELVLGIDTLFN